eukprot:136231-Rhodomonas_salina.1
MKVLMDDGRSERPTLANILAGFRWLVRGAREGDSLFFHYSGAGHRVPVWALKTVLWGLGVVAFEVWGFGVRVSGLGLWALGFGGLGFGG